MFNFSYVRVFRQLGLDLVPRIETEQVDVEKVSPVELYRIHETSEEAAKCTTVSGLYCNTENINS